MSLGLKRETVKLESHDKQWDEIAGQTIKTLKSILGDDAIDIQHIGSTAIPAIKAPFWMRREVPKSRCSRLL